MSVNKTPKIIMGCTELGSNTSINDSQKMLDIFIDNHNSNENIYLDTSFVYGRGKSEESLEYVSKNMNTKFKDKNILISTKVHAIKGLDSKGINYQINISLNERMKLKCVDILYIHQPSMKYPIINTLIAINDVYNKGLFKRFGLCNFSAWEVTKIIYLCKKLNLNIIPTVYQGRYNPLRRECEIELLPCLKHFNIEFYGYSPLARGLMVGKYNYNDAFTGNIADGKFTYKGLKKNLHFVDYWKKCYFDGIDIIKNAINKYDNKLTLIEATYSWLVNHSMLDGNKGDGIIFGCSKIYHIQSNINLIKNAKILHPNIVSAFDDAWHIARQGMIPYFRSYETVRNAIKSFDYNKNIKSKL